MKALQITRPRAFATVQVPTPRLEPSHRGRILVRTAFASICGSDIPFFNGSRPGLRYPLPAGARAHECLGQVVQSTSDHFRPGDWAVAIPDADLGLAELYVAEDSRAAWLSSDRIDRGAACLIQPLATVMYAIDRLGALDSRSLAVVGLGSMGLLFCWLLHRLGAARVVGVDPLPDRCDAALRLGADRAYPVRSLELVRTARGDPSRWTPPEVCIEAVGHQLETLNDCIDLVREQGMVVAFGVPDQDVYPLAFETLFRKNVALVACVTPPWAAYLAKARDLFDSCRPDLATFFTRRYPMRDAAEAFAAYERREPGLIKLILDASDWEPSRPVRQAAATASRR